MLCPQYRWAGEQMGQSLATSEGSSLASQIPEEHSPGSKDTIRCDKGTVWRTSWWEGWGPKAEFGDSKKSWGLEGH